jgi:hypothetical protein
MDEKNGLMNVYDLTKVKGIKLSYQYLRRGSEGLGITYQGLGIGYRNKKAQTATGAVLLCSLRRVIPLAERAHQFETNQLCLHSTATPTSQLGS